ncbi:MAG: hypothetical protein B7Y97_04145 [Sphingomonas sp. 32-66-10]|nr:MAG: hypothetical protein B7Y97_04145 [Sphingomonas sp. 32-66-10]
MDRVDYQSMIVQDLVNDYRDDKLDLNPWYQRRSVWTRPQKAYLINTILERKPIPAIYVRHSIDMDKGKSIKEVVDGQQRARTIIEFCDDEFTARTGILSERKSFLQMTPTEREKFLLTPISVGFLLGATDKDVIDIFARINSVSKTLNAQEKRNARFSGEFKQFVIHESASRLNFWRNFNIFTANDIARMNEVQFVSDIILNMMNGLSDFTPASLDRIYEENDDEFPRQKEISDRLNYIFEKIFSLDKRSIVDTIFQRQPLIFSLMLALDGKNITTQKLQDSLFKMDAQFKDEALKSNEIEAFRSAVASTTQRISSRRIRDAFIKKHL